MKKLIASFMLLAMLCGLSAPAFAEEAVVITEAISAVADVAAEVAAPAEAVVEAVAPVPNKGDTTWMLLSTLLVILMIVPGLSLFYGGLVRAKNMLSVLSQVFAIFALISILWVIYGYTLAFGDGGGFNWMIGDLSKLFLA
ncbi:MAG: ammonia channel protein, partial [Gallionella sp.]|nr:ammonia channel protein [Gallionella sp.]